jgi:5-methylcytosine-specific restriction protein A
VHADHWPLSRRELVEQGLDPDDPKHGRGLCTSCHSRSTAREQPGGWNR